MIDHEICIRVAERGWTHGCKRCRDVLLRGEHEHCEAEHGGDKRFDEHGLRRVDSIREYGAIERRGSALHQ